MFRGVSDGAGKRIFNLLKACNLRERKSGVKRVTLIKTRVNDGDGDSSCSGKVKNVADTTEATNVADTTKATNVVIAGTRNGGKLFEKDKSQ